MGEAPTRLEAFSDVVFAIAITLLILEIKVPHVEHGLWAGLLARWPSYVAFLMSFVVILIMWVNHHELVRMVQRVNYPILFANGLRAEGVSHRSHRLPGRHDRRAVSAGGGVAHQCVAVDTLDQAGVSF